VKLNLGYRPLFWITGILVFFISSVVNGLTSGLLMGAVVVAVGRNNPRFVSLACLNIVVACNAGGTFSPLGGISTLFVWQQGVLQFTEFFTLFLPCLVNFLVPAAIMHFAVPKGKPTLVVETIELPRGTKRIIFLFGLTIVLAVIFNMVLELPPAAGMMAGLSLLQFFEYYLMKTVHLNPRGTRSLDIQQYPAEPEVMVLLSPDTQRQQSYAIFEKIGRLEWDTLLFFYGAMVGIGGLGFIGYLDAISGWLYGQHSATLANIMVGLSSAFVDNGTLMFAVLAMHPDIPQGQWLLVTLTLGVGGSLLAIGSAPGIGLMGISKGKYSFGSHMKWCPVILLGYFAAIGIHFLVNAHSF
ncbi:MAG: sodium:proton antiporter NhaD, partial [Methylococcaceae bacterium]|nr:sodium:proton antiporter NhaD [Methylococcaceae bacterium]